MEGTSEDVSRQDISVEKTPAKQKRRRLKERPSILRGVPVDLCCRVCDFLEFTGIDAATFDRMGLSRDIGTHAAWMFTSEFHNLVASGVKVAPAEKKKRTKK